jgi:hypothetical protein
LLQSNDGLLTCTLLQSIFAAAVIGTLMSLDEYVAGQGKAAIKGS